jgi:cyclic pyranopterin phosphate synthase
MVRLPVYDRARHDLALRMAAARAPSLGLAPVAPRVGPGEMRDGFGRRITYLRLSVTDRCNLRCIYCTPVSNGDFVPREELLTDDEIIAVLGTMARHGLEKVRFTGGEPLVRPGFVDLVRRARAIPGLAELCLSTNGVLLEAMAPDLLAAGITHVNVSVDTLDPARFERVTRGGSLERVWRGIERVLAIGLPVVKLNAVLMRGVNDGEIEDFARLTYRLPVSVRFIELMPLAHCGEVHEDLYVPADAVLATLAGLGDAEEVARGANDGPARCFRLPGARGSVGIITPVSESLFCARCNRVRLSATGQLKLCLFGDEYVDIRAALRAGGDPRVLESALIRAMALKPEKMAGHSGFTMIAIGG